MWSSFMDIRDTAYRSCCCCCADLLPGETCLLWEEGGRLWCQCNCNVKHSEPFLHGIVKQDTASYVVYAKEDTTSYYHGLGHQTHPGSRGYFCDLAHLRNEAPKPWPWTTRRGRVLVCHDRAMHLLPPYSTLIACIPCVINTILK